ncbi:unnamed protein product [Rhizoctonia solani]|uniref:Laminin domain protein n=1 Tax=Rhizoctonia solani TaxID=456999 RepID=A0A8H3BH15_9AGAM|nr:unnamed protein product [Rhizoctonia solani]
MVQHAKLSTTVYNPPSLPAYLACTHHLKAISGVPSDEDIKAIHAVIKAVNGISHIPGMHDPDLSIQLAKHLFDVQMAVYRGQYSFSPFPGDIVYTPPPLPSHIPVTLQPVIGAPSDEELKLVHNMVRAAESLANTSSVFDPDLSMKLSQYLFNINIARYIRDSMQSQLGSPVGDLLKSEQTPSQSDLPASNPQLIPVARDQPCLVPSTMCSASITEGLPAQTKAPNLHDAMIDIKNAQEETNHIMNETNETLKSINRTLVSTQLTLFLVGKYCVAYHNCEPDKDIIRPRIILAARCISAPMIGGNYQQTMIFPV